MATRRAPAASAGKRPGRARRARALAAAIRRLAGTVAGRLPHAGSIVAANDPQA